MAITFVGSSNVANGLANGTSAVVPRPAGVVDGDRLLAFISIGTVGAIGAPAGWVEVPLSVNTAPNLQNRVYTKVASSEPATWTWTFASSAYVGIAHATRGVGAVFAANQSDDGLSLLSHTTPVLPAPAGAWLISSWTGRSLLALGWAAPAGDTERQDVIGGLLVLLNVNHAVDDTNAPVVAGNYSKTTATLLAVRALCGLVVLAPVLDPITGPGIDGRVSFATATMGLGTVATPIVTSSGFSTATMGMGVVGTPVISAQTFGLAEMVPGNVDLTGIPFTEHEVIPTPLIDPGNVDLIAQPFTIRDLGGDPEIVPGNVDLVAEPISTVLEFGDPVILLGFALGGEPWTEYATFPDFLTGQQIGILTPGQRQFLASPNSNQVFAESVIFGVNSTYGPCCN